MVALELYVIDESRKKYLRAFAWIRLVRNWMSLRWSDTKGVTLANLRCTAGGLHAKMDNTKVSGPVRKLRWLHGYVSKDAWIVVDNWLLIGYELWCGEGFNFDRDYWVPLPAESFKCARPDMAEAAEAAAINVILMCDLCWPELAESTVEGSDVPIKVWTEGDRNFDWYTAD